jgi:2-phospho-L-lactate guanylyltransferase (CobY/MobA/RfbA family)
LPLVTPEEIRRLIQEARFERGVAIVPDCRHQGTNALLVRPPGILDYQFGGHSFEAHVQQARQKNLEVRVVESQILGFDLDLPEDLEWLRQFNPMSVVP